MKIPTKEELTEFMKEIEEKIKKKGELTKNMHKIPELKILVEKRNYPTLFRRHKWNYRILTTRQGIDGWGWYTYYDGYAWIAEGTAKTEEKALKKARETASYICDKHLNIARLEKERLSSQIIEKVNCEGI